MKQAPAAHKLRLGQFRERPALRVRESVLGLIAAALLLVLAASGCDKLPPVLVPGYDQLEQQIDAAKAVVESTCAAGESEPCTGARALVAELQELLRHYYPNGKPTPPPSTPPTTQPETPPVTEPPAPPTPPPAAGCVLSGEPSQALPDTYQPQHKAAVLAAIRRARPTCIFGDCLIEDYSQQTWQAAVEAEVRKGGADPQEPSKVYPPLCSGQHAKSTDEIAVAATAGDPQEGYDVFSGDDSGLIPRPAGSSRRTIVWAVYRGAWYPPGQQPTPGPTAPPTPAPEPTAGCSAPVPVLATFAVKIHEGFCANVDSTAKVRGRDYCKAIGFTDGRGECPVRQEGAPDREACERVAIGGDGKPSMRCEDGCQVYQCGGKGEDGSDNCACGTPLYVNRNPYRAVVIGKGTVYVCGADGQHCGSLVVGQ